jgi:hypothetical protein
MASPEILTKIKLLLNLAKSANPNEAGNAKVMADRLIEKHNVTQEELKSIETQPEKYGQDELLFHSFRIINWEQHLALACAKHFFCYIVQEVVKPGTGNEEYNYYVYGDDEDVNYVKFSFFAFHKKIDNLIKTKCVGRGPIYIDSYCEGVIEAVKSNIAMDGFEIPEIKRPSRSLEPDDKVLNNGDSNLSTVKVEKGKPENETVNISGSLIKDIAAYFKGVGDGKNLSLQDILELEAENERVKEISSATETPSVNGSDP